MLPKRYRNRADFYTKKRTKTLSFSSFGKQTKRFWGIYERHPGFLEFLDKRNFKDNTYGYVPKKAIANITIPDKFSFYDNPEGCLLVLKQLVGAYSDPRISEIYIDHRACEEIDLAASMMMDAILWEIDVSRKLIGNEMIFSGTIKHEKNNKNSENILELLACSGVLKHLGIISNLETPEHIETLDFFDDYIKQNKNIDHKSAGQRITEYFNRCYKKCGFCLTESGFNKLSDLVAEIVLNCENHCGDKPKRWFCQGHYFVGQNDNGSSRIGECQLSIISIGQSFYESINNSGTDYIKGRCEEQYDKIEPGWKSFLEKLDFRLKKKRELFYLLFCLQENISRLKDMDINVDRGKGTVTLFENFQEIGKTSDGKNPHLSITSGSAQVLFDGTYKMKSNKDGIRIIAFNENNDIDAAPDSKYVHNIKSFFPGVIINLRFYIDENYLEKIIDERGCSN